MSQPQQFSNIDERFGQRGMDVNLSHYQQFGGEFYQSDVGIFEISNTSADGQTADISCVACLAEDFEFFNCELNGWFDQSGLLKL